MVCQVLSVINNYSYPMQLAGRCKFKFIRTSVYLTHSFYGVLKATPKRRLGAKAVQGVKASQSP
jgi:hypothetical protein